MRNAHVKHAMLSVEHANNARLSPLAAPCYVWRMSTPEILKIVAEKREALAAQKHAVELLEAEIRGMELILAMIPQTPLAPTKLSPASEPPLSGQRGAGGRQPGAISNKWKRHLLALDDSKAFFSLEDVIELVEDREGRTMRPSEVKRIFDKYVEQGHVQESADLYTVPDSTVQKFKAILRDSDDDLRDEIDLGSSQTKRSESTQTSNEDDYGLDDDLPSRKKQILKDKYDLDDDIPF